MGRSDEFVDVEIQRMCADSVEKGRPPRLKVSPPTAATSPLPDSKDIAFQTSPETAVFAPANMQDTVSTRLRSASCSIAEDILPLWCAAHLPMDDAILGYDIFRAYNGDFDRLTVGSRTAVRLTADHMSRDDGLLCSPSAWCC